MYDACIVRSSLPSKKRQTLRRRTVALCLERTAFDTDDKPVEVMTAYYDLKNEYCGLVLR